jgi:TATA-box binding protein (TBP) (component of TFIID and TFIIIB)
MMLRLSRPLLLALLMASGSLMLTGCKSQKEETAVSSSSSISSARSGIRADEKSERR